MLLAHPGCCEKCCCVRWAGTLLCCRPSTSRRAVTFKCSINPCERIKCPLGTQGGKRSRSEPAGLTEPLGRIPWNPRAGRGPAQSPLASRSPWGVCAPGPTVPGREAGTAGSPGHRPAEGRDTRGHRQERGRALSSVKPCFNSSKTRSLTLLPVMKFGTLLVLSDCRAQGTIRRLSQI